MSSEKLTLNIEDILSRVAEVIDLKKYRNVDVAEALHVKPAVSKNWTLPGRKTIPWETLFTFCQERNLTLDWLLSGTGPKYKTDVASSDQHCCDPTCPLANSRQATLNLCGAVKEVVESGTHWGLSLEANIHSFRTGYDNDQKVLKNSSIVDDLIRDNKDLKKEIRKLKSTVNTLQKAQEHRKHLAGEDFSPATDIAGEDGTQS